LLLLPKNLILKEKKQKNIIFFGKSKKYLYICMEIYVFALKML